MPRGLVRGWTKHLTPPVPGWARTDPLDRGLVGEWRFDPATGLTLPDYSGRGNHGDNTGADWINTERGPALHFVTANSDYVDTGVERISGTGLFCTAGEAFTVEMMFRIVFNETGAIVARAAAVFADRTFAVYFWRPGDPGNIPAILLRGGVAGLTEPLWGYDDGTIHVIHVTWDGSTAMAYGDGGNSVVCNVGVAAENVGQRIIFGARTNGAGLLLDGDIFSVRIWDRALSAAEAHGRYKRCLKRANPMTSAWMMPWGRAPAAVVGQPIELRGTCVPYLRQWQPRIS